MKAKKPSKLDLMRAEIEALRKEIEELKKVEPVVNNNHYHFTPQPYNPWLTPAPYRPWWETVTCGGTGLDVTVTNG